MICKLSDIVNTANTGADAIKKAPILNEPTNLRCLRIGDVSQKRDFSMWGYTKTSKMDYERYKLHKGDSIIARTGNTIGVCTYIEDDIESVYNNGLIRLTAKTELARERFLFYLIRSTACQDYIQSIAYGTSTQPNMKIKDFLNFDIIVPTLEIQDKIIAIVDKIEKKIQVNTKINNNLEQQAKALYKDWFFDFSPFSTEGNLPDGWHLGTVGDIIQLHDSKRVPLSGSERDKMEKIYPYYGATSLMDYVDNYLFDGIYLLLGEDGTVIDSLGFPILQYVYGQFWVNNHAHIITGKEGFSVEELYLFFSLTNIKSIVTGAVQQKVSQQNLKKVPAIIPSKEALSAFDDLIQPIFAQIRNLRDENARLADLRDTILPRLMSGELDISGIDL